MKSKPAENFLSLQCKDRAPYSLPPSIFTDGFSPAASYDRHGQETFHLNEGKTCPLYPYTKVVWENCVTHLGTNASVFMSFTRHCH